MLHHASLGESLVHIMARVCTSIIQTMASSIILHYIHTDAAVSWQTNRHLFNVLFSWTTQVRWQQKGKSFWILVNQKRMRWQWHPLNHMQITYTSIQTDNHVSTSSLNFYKSAALPATQPTVSKHQRQCSKLASRTKTQYTTIYRVQHYKTIICKNCNNNMKRYAIFKDY